LRKRASHLPIHFYLSWWTRLNFQWIHSNLWIILHSCIKYHHKLYIFHCTCLYSFLNENPKGLTSRYCERNRERYSVLSLCVCVCVCVCMYVCVRERNVWSIHADHSLIRIQMWVFKKVMFPKMSLITLMMETVSSSETSVSIYYGATSQTTAIFILVAMRTSNLT
jgi:hypothetical protein